MKDIPISLFETGIRLFIAQSDSTPVIARSVGHRPAARIVFVGNNPIRSLTIVGFGSNEPEHPKHLFGGRRQPKLS